MKKKKKKKKNKQKKKKKKRKKEKTDKQTKTSKQTNNPKTSRKTKVCHIAIQVIQRVRKSDDNRCFNSRQFCTLICVSRKWESTEKSV